MSRGQCRRHSPHLDVEGDSDRAVVEIREVAKKNDETLALGERSNPRPHHGILLGNVIGRDGFGWVAIPLGVGRAAPPERPRLVDHDAPYPRLERRLARGSRRDS